MNGEPRKKTLYKGRHCKKIQGALHAQRRGERCVFRGAPDDVAEREMKLQMSTADPRAAIWGRLFFFRCLLFLRGAVCMFQQPFAVGPAIQPQAFGDNRPVFHAHT